MADEETAKTAGEVASSVNGSNGAHHAAATSETPKPAKAQGKTSASFAEEAREAPAKEPAPQPPPEEAIAAEPTAVSPQDAGGGLSRSLIAAGIAGAATAVLVLALARLLFGGTDPGLAERLATLEARVTANAAAVGDPEALARLEARIAASDPAGLAQRLATLDRRLAAVEGRVEGLAEMGPGGIEPQALTRLETRFNGFMGEADQRGLRIEGRLDRLEALTPEDLRTQLDAFAAAETVGALEGRIAALERNEIARDTRRAVLAVALASLVRASAGSEPFAPELDALAILAPGVDGISALEPFAAKGVPTEPMLVASFKPAARKALHADAAASANEGWLVKLWANLRNAVIVRTARDIESEGANGILARAEDRLGEGNLAAAIAQVKTLQGPAAEAIAPWLAEAESRAGLNALIDGVSGRLLADLGREM